MINEYGVTPICLNKTQFDKANKRYGLTNCCYLYNAFDPQELLSDISEKEELKKELGIPKDSFIVGAIGRVDPVKNYSFLIKVFEKLAAIKNNVILLIVGDDSGADNLKQIIKKLNLETQIKFLGVRNNIGSLINIFDRFVTTSITEASSIVVLEAQLFDKYCVISNAIPKESICLNNHIVRLDLKDDVNIWASELLEPTKYEKATSHLEDYFIKNAAKKMINIYKGKI